MMLAYFRQRLGAIALGLLFATLSLESFAQLHWLEHARTEITIDGKTTIKEVRLPYMWDGEHTGHAGHASFHLAFVAPPTGQEPLGLFLPRVGNAYEVWLNGALIERRGDLQLHNGSDFSKSPRFVPIALDSLRVENELVIKIYADSGRKGGLSRVAVGSLNLAQQAFDESWRARVLGLVVVTVFSSVVGLLGLALWVTQGGRQPNSGWPRDPMYLYGAVAELCWSLRVFDALLETPPIDWPLWAVIPVLALGGWASCTALLCAEVAGWQGTLALQRFKRLLLALMLAGLGLGHWALVHHHPLALTAWYGALGLTFLCFSLVFMRAAVQKNATYQARLLAAAVLINVVSGLYDFYNIRVDPSTANRSTLYYASVAFGLVVGLIVVQRFRSMSQKAHDLTVNLQQIVQYKELELADSYQRMELLARQEERTQERSRILRDLHDGVGAHISTAIRQLKSGKASDVEVLHTLSESLDHLKLSIDAMHLPAGDITALLANLRYRLEPRLKASDIDLQWQVDVLDVCPRLGDKAMRHLLFMVYEAVSNVLQHSQATTLRIESVQTISGSRITLTDNGIGFNVDQPLQKGLQSMRERAQIIGAELTFHSIAGQTVVAILLPP
jgi:signal transduction histidine kinase